MYSSCSTSPLLDYDFMRAVRGDKFYVSEAAKLGLEHHADGWLVYQEMRVAW